MKKTEFDPYRWAKDGYCEKPGENPLWMALSIDDQAEQIIRENPNNEDLVRLATTVRHLAQTIAQLFKVTPDGSTGEQSQPVRKALVMAYNLGTLADSMVARTSDESFSETLQIVEQHIAKGNSRKATDGRHGPNRERKRRAIAWYKDRRRDLGKKDSAAQAIADEFNVSFSTARDWIKGI